MKNKFEFDYLKDDFKELSGFILENTPNNREEEYFNKILFKIQSYYTNACVFIKEQSNIIDELTSNITSLENELNKNINLYNDLTLENDNLQTNLSQSYNTIESQQKEIEKITNDYYDMIDMKNYLKERLNAYKEVSDILKYNLLEAIDLTKDK
jgi:regulator of replication initiation timing